MASLVSDALDRLGASGATLEILDCGGGSGAFAVPLAAAGRRVTVVDVSADALATLRRRADEAGVADHVRSINGDVEELDSFVAPGSVDAVLAHGILGAVDDPRATLRQLVTALRPGGLMSLLIANPDAAVLSRALGGDPVQALAELRALDSASALRRPADVESECRALGLEPYEPAHRHGVGVFSDLVPGAALDAPGAREAVRELDLAAAGRAPFAELAARVHLLFRRPVEGGANGT